jgi:hypothetical protein
MIKIIILIAICFLTSCVGKLPSALDVANDLEKITPGTDFTELKMSRINVEGLKPRNIRYIFDAWIIVDPNDKKLYRQWPKGILLNLKENDQFITLPVKDNKYGTGRVEMFFNSSLQYKGYFAYSNMIYSIDKSERYSRELYDYKIFGIDKEREYAQKRVELRKADSHNWRNYLPKLPLRND